MTDTPPLDRLKQPITEGSYIVYAAQFGQSPVLQVGKVLAVKQKRDYLDRLEWRILVQGLSAWGDVLMRKSTLGHPSRITVVPESLVPAEYLSLLKDAK